MRWLQLGGMTCAYVSGSPYSGEIPAEICVSGTVRWPNDRTLVEFQSYFPNLHKENPTVKGTSSDFDLCLTIYSHQGFGVYLKLYSYLNQEILQAQTILILMIIVYYYNFKFLFDICYRLDIMLKALREQHYQI